MAHSDQPSTGLGVGLVKLEYLEIVVKDWQAAMAWYEEKLGLRVVEIDEGDRWCRLEFLEGGTAITLWQPDDDYQFDRGTQFIPILFTRNMRIAVLEMEARGVVFNEGIRCICNGRRWITTFLDCEGNTLQLMQ